jgi:hypothetical protein
MLLEDLQPIGFARITIIFCHFAHLYNLNTGFTLYKENKSELLNRSSFYSLLRSVRRGLMGDRAARIGGCGFPVPRAKALGALREELGPPTKAGAAPPRRGLPDEGGGALDLPGPTGASPGGVMERAPSPLSRRGTAGSGARP